MKKERRRLLFFFGLFGVILNKGKYAHHSQSEGYFMYFFFESTYFIRINNKEYESLKVEP